MEALLKPCQSCHKPMNGGMYRAPNVCPHCNFEHEGLGRKKNRKVSLKAVSKAPSDAVIADDNNAAVPLNEQYGVEEIEPESATPNESVQEVQAAEADAAEAAPTETAEAVESSTADASEAVSEPAKAAEVEVDPEVLSKIVLSGKPLSEHTIAATLDDVTANCVLNLKLTPDLFEDGKFLGAKADKVQAALKQGRKHVLAQLRAKAYDGGANLVAGVVVKNAIKAVDNKTAKITVQAKGQGAVAEMDEEVETF